MSVTDIKDITQNPGTLKNSKLRSGEKA